MRLTAQEAGDRTDILLGLSPEAISDRRKSIGASDANVILGGDATKLMQLWRFKVGLDEAEDLSGILPVQMGVWTERFNLRWYEKQTGNPVSQLDTKLSHPKHSWLTCTLDGVTRLEPGTPIPIEAKHVGPFNYTLDAIVQRYRPQLTVQMACMDAPQAVLSVFSGNSKWEYAVLDRDFFYEDRLILECKRFWACVTAKLPPIDLPDLQPEVPVSLWRDVDYATNNAWCNHEQDYLEHEAGAKLFEHAEKELRVLVPADAKTCTGKFLVARRSKSGALRFFKKKGSSK
jgi:YqaJ-like viral recombinase domain